MKKNIFTTTLAIALSIFGLMAQTTEFDAIRVAQSDISGTARFMGMAGAFGALGGDASAIHINPAGLGVYRSSELTTTFNLATQNSNANWDGIRAHDNMTRFGFQNFGLVWSNPTMNARRENETGLLRSNWAFSYNRLRDFNRNVTIRGNEMATSITDFYANLTQGLPEAPFGSPNTAFRDPDIPWMSILAYQTFLIDNVSGTNWSSALFDGEMVSPRYFLDERGQWDELSISWGGNISNTFFIGANVNFQSIDHTIRSRYIEEFGVNENLNVLNRMHTTGTGVNFGIGIIYRPIHEIRFGFSYKTPTRFSLTHNHSATMRSNLFFDQLTTNVFETPQGIYDHRVQTPGVFRASVAGIIGQRAIISTDIVATNFSHIRILEPNRWDGIYADDNEAIRNTFSNSFTVKFGAEYRITNQFSVRAGFARQTPTMTTSAMKQHKINTTRTDTEYFINQGVQYITTGFGYRGNFWYFDAALVNRSVQEYFMPFAASNNNNSARVTTHNFDVVATVGLRF